MKTHRWVRSVALPVKMLQNEDQTFYYTPSLSVTEEMMGPAWCWDCEQALTECWGEPCPGFDSTGGVDGRIPNRYWEQIDD